MQVLHSAVDERFLGCPHAFFFYARLSDLLVVANSSLNVFVYCRFSRHFTRAVRGAAAGGVPTRRHRGPAAAAAAVWSDDSVDSRRETIARAAAASLAASGGARIAMATLGAGCLLYTSPSPRDRTRSRMPSSA